MSPAAFVTSEISSQLNIVHSSGRLTSTDVSVAVVGVRIDSYYKLVRLLMNRMLLIKVDSKRK